MFAATAGRHLASTSVIAATALVGCFSVGIVAVHSMRLGLLLIGALACLIVYLTGPRRMVLVALFLACASLPASLHVGKVIGPVAIDEYHAAVMLAIVFLIPVARLRFSQYVLPLILLLTVAVFTVLGLMAGNEPVATAREATFLCEMIAGFVLAVLIVRADYVRQSIWVASAVMWFSAGMILASSLTGLRLAGRAESLAAETGVDAIRIVTVTQAPAVAVLTALVAAQIIGRARWSTWLMLGVPALMITLLSFSRHTLIGLAVAAVVAIAANLGWAAIRRLASIVAVGAAVLAVVTPAALFLLQNYAAGAWLSKQVDAFSHRVLDGVSTSALEVDSSTLARLHENTNLWRAIGESPLLGHGLGYAYQLPFGPAGSFTADLGPTYAHNFYLWWLVKAGVIGMVVFALFALVPVVRALRAASAPATIAAAVSAGLLAICVVDPLPLERASSLVLGIALGAAAAFSRSAPPAAEPIRSPAASTAPSAVHTNG
jgi:O-antigen ligase